MKEIKSIVTDKIQFDKRDKTFLENPVELWNNETLMQGSISIVSQSNLPVHVLGFQMGL